MAIELTELVDLAITSSKNAYNPYSNFPVGAALITESGRTFTGCNIENASFGLTICAERVCLFNYINSGAINDPINKFVVTGNTPAPISPCGACRQVMAEFMTPETKIYLTNFAKTIKQVSLAELLPYHFTQEDIVNGQK